MPYYKVNRISSLFFIIFTIFTQFFFLRLILAASFTNYKRDYEERHRRRLAFKDVAILKAFALLTGSSPDREKARQIIQQPRGRKVRLVARKYQSNPRASHFCTTIQ